MSTIEFRSNQTIEVIANGDTTYCGSIYRCKDNTIAFRPPQYSSFTVQQLEVVIQKMKAAETIIPSVNQEIQPTK